MAERARISRPIEGEQPGESKELSPRVVMPEPRPERAPSAEALLAALKRSLLDTPDLSDTIRRQLASDLDRVSQEFSLPSDVVKVAEALEQMIDAREPVEGLPDLAAHLFRCARSSELVSVEALTQFFFSHRALLRAEDNASLRAQMLPQLVGAALSCPAFRDAPGGLGVALLGDIIEKLPLNPLHRSVRELVGILGPRAELEDLRALRDLLFSEDTSEGVETSFGIYCRAFADLQAPVSWRECRELLQSSLANGFRGGRVLLRAYSELLKASVHPLAVECFVRTMPALAREEPSMHHGSLAASAAKAWVMSPPPEPACRSYLDGWGTPQRESVRARFARLASSCFERVPSDEVQWPVLEGLVGAHLFRPLAAERHELHKRLADVHRGYAAALRFDVNRLPGETVSPLVRFGLDIGDVQLIHASTPAGFPGHGVVLSRINPLRAFPARREREEPLEAYRDAWPSLRDVIGGLGDIRVFFTRGFFGIEPPKSLTLSVGARAPRHYTLLLFNDHHLNESLVKALLVDSEWLARRINPCLKEWRKDWFEGAPEQHAEDANAIGLSPGEILSRNTSRDIVAIDVGSPATMLSGFAYGIAPGTPPLFSHDPRYPEDAPVTAFGHTYTGGLPLPGGSLQARFSALSRVDFSVQEYLTSALSYLECFQLAHANVHKGFAGSYGLKVNYGIGAGASRRLHVVPSIFGPLDDALKRHRALVAEGGLRTDNDPMLVTTNARSYSEPPDGDFVLDLRTLECRVDGLPFRLFPPGQPILSDRVRSIWVGQVVPRISDSFQDLRVVPRGQLRRVGWAGRRW